MAKKVFVLFIINCLMPFKPLQSQPLFKYEAGIVSGIIFPQNSKNLNVSNSGLYIPYDFSFYGNAGTGLKSTIYIDYFLVKKLSVGISLSTSQFPNSKGANYDLLINQLGTSLKYSPLFSGSRVKPFLQFNFNNSVISIKSEAISEPSQFVVVSPTGDSIVVFYEIKIPRFNRKFNQASFNGLIGFNFFLKEHYGLIVSASYQLLLTKSTFTFQETGRFLHFNSGVFYRFRKRKIVWQ